MGEALASEWRSRPGWDPILIADRLARSLAFARHRLTLPLARAARRFVRDKEWFSFGYARLEDHARERFDRSARWVRDLAALAEAAERLPALSRALEGEDGHSPIGRVPALLIGRAASVETCEEWIALARASTSRGLKEGIDRARLAGSLAPLPGESPGSVPRMSPDGPHGDLGRRLFTTFREASPAEPETKADERCTIRFAMPPPVGAAFDEARDLHDAVSGGQTSLVSFLEALVAEAHAGPASPLDPDGARGPGRVSKERAMALASEGWAFLRSLPDEENVLAEAAGTLREVERMRHTAEAGADHPDTLIRSLLKMENEIELRLGELLAEMGESGAWRGLQFAGVGHYGEQRLGLSRTVAEDCTRLFRALRARPLVRQAYEEARIGSNSAALVLRALDGAPADDSFDRAWVEHAGKASVKRMRDEIRRLGQVDVRMDGTDGPPPSQVKSYGSPAAGLRSSRLPADDATWRASLARRPGDARKRIALCAAQACEDLRTLIVRRFRIPTDLAADLLAAVTARRRAVEALIRRQRDAEGARAARMFSIARMGLDAAGEASPLVFVPEWIGLLGLLEDFVSTWDDPRQSPKRASDQVYIRDGWRCSAPGCTSRQNLEDHHIVYRSRGGTDTLSNRITLCRFHHQLGEHGDLLTCRGKAPLGIAWRLGRNGKGGAYRNERLLAGR